MTFRATKPPVSRGPALDPRALFFFGPRLGYAATTGGAAQVPKVGWSNPVEPGTIQMTTDGGATWRTLWSGRNVVLRQIAFSDRANGIAFGVVVERSREYGPPPSSTPILLATHDAGRVWKRVPPPQFHRERYETLALPRIQPLDAQTWIAYGRGTARTDDGGQTWRPLPTPRDATTVRFSTRSLAFAGARGSTTCPGLFQLWRSADGGSTWLPVAGTCGASVNDIEFVPPKTVFIGLSDAFGPEVETGWRTTIRRSDDGGSTWQTVFTDPRGRWPGVDRISFADANHGWAISDLVSQGFEFAAVHVTNDGGRTWRERPFPHAVPTAFAGARFAWGTDATGAAVTRTTDGGVTWHESIRPRPNSVCNLLFATRRAVAVFTAAGTAISIRQGWRSRPSISRREAARELAATAYLAVNDQSGVPLITSDHGRTWRRLRLPPGLAFGIGAVAFTNSNHGLLADGDPYDGGVVPVFRTVDGGRSWRGARLPHGVQAQAEADLGPGVIVLPTGLDPPRKVAALLSVDGGRHWSRWFWRADVWSCGIQRPEERTIWILCSLTVSRGPTVLFVSHDRGETWTKRRGPVQLDRKFVAVSRTEAWAAGDANARDFATLWHTTDEGRTWTQVRVDLPPSSRVYELVRGGAGRPLRFGCKDC
ncbi:MAG: hypothetical protein M3R70_03850 [Actinomycetota bacterium]|nr:hypothetical protein [Actinomycetota bacterium]